MALTVKWDTVETVLVARVGILDFKQSIAFDLDDTLITRSSRALMPGVLAKLTELAKSYNIVILSNQKISHVKDATLKSKFEGIAAELKLPLLALFARGDDNYRKPGIGTISLMPQKPEYYVGDAAGRIRDHSDCDKKFAATANIPFFTPEEFFGNTEPVKPNAAFELPKTPTIIVLTGYPASGKSTWAREQKLSIASRDQLKTMDKCCQYAAQEIKGGRSVIIDNLNTDTKARKQFIQLAKAAGVPCVSVLVDLDSENAIKNNSNRAAKVPNMVIYKFRKAFQPPTLDEGFDSVYTVKGFKTL